MKIAVFQAASKKQNIFTKKL